MILAVIGWIGLFTLCQCKSILVSNEGNNSVDCCARGREKCHCSSFIDALNHLESDTLINITVRSVTLHNHTAMVSLNHVTILGNGATVMCNHTGSMNCRFCSNIKLEGITWDQCANSEFTVGISFLFASNIKISMCTFQNSNACASIIILMLSGSVEVQRCRFLFNHVGNISDCPVYAGLFILNNNFNTAQSLTVMVTKTLFHHNGIFGPSDELYYALGIVLFELSETTLHIDNSTVSACSGLGGEFYLNNTGNTTVLFNNTVFTHNRYGGAEVRIFNKIPNTHNYVVILSSTFAYNINGSIKLIVIVAGLSSCTGVLLNSSTIKGNVGTFGEDPSIDSDFNDQGTGILLWFSSFTTYIEISFCNISSNDGGDGSIVYIKDGLRGVSNNQIVIRSSKFTGNHGSALYFLKCNAVFQGSSSFTNNLAQSGAAIYFTQNSQATIDENSKLEFVNNVASLFGGAVYVSVPPECIYQGITFTNLPNTSVVSFVNNSAEIAGDSLYFSIPESCSVVGNSSNNNSLVYIPYQFTYKELPGSVVPEISTSPYAVNLCSKECTTSNLNDCNVNDIMLGQSIYFNASVCDYYNNVSEPVQFLMEYVNCNGEYRLSDSKILLHSGLSKFAVSAIDANRDISTNKNITIELTSVNSYEYRQLSATTSIILSPCHGGYIFNVNLQQCKCYDHNQDVVQCQEDYAEIKYGHWFGRVSSILRTSSLCPTYYCDFDRRIETRAGYYNLPNKENDQCNLHRVGMACGECTAGHTLAYDSTDCIDANNCTPGITILVIILTILYWIAIVAVIFGLMYLKSNISLGYVYGILFYYRIVDILLGSNLYISVGVFQLTTILSSFAKLTPQFLGKLCFVQGLSGIDQQFIHYAHALAVFLLTIVIVIAARWSMKIASIVSHCLNCQSLHYTSYLSSASVSLYFFSFHITSVVEAFIFS